MKIEKIVIGTSDYSRKQIEADECYWVLGSSAKEWKRKINQYEAVGYKVKFETSLFRKIFCVGIYKVVAYKELLEENNDAGKEKIFPVTHCPLCDSTKIKKTTFSDNAYCCLECDGYWVN